MKVFLCLIAAVVHTYTFIAFVAFIFNFNIPLQYAIYYAYYNEFLPFHVYFALSPYLHTYLSASHMLIIIVWPFVIFCQVDIMSLTGNCICLDGSQQTLSCGEKVPYNQLHVLVHSDYVS